MRREGRQCRVPCSCQFPIIAITVSGAPNALPLAWWPGAKDDDVATTGTALRSVLPPSQAAHANRSSRAVAGPAHCAGPANSRLGPGEPRARLKIARFPRQNLTAPIRRRLMTSPAKSAFQSRAWRATRPDVSGMPTAARAGRAVSRIVEFARSPWISPKSAPAPGCGMTALPLRRPPGRRPVTILIKMAGRKGIVVVIHRA